MHPHDYVLNVLKTEPTQISNPSLLGRFVEKLFASLNSKYLAGRLTKKRNVRLLHGAMGVVTEVAELFEMLDKDSLDLVNLQEEVGDSLWYCGIASDELGLDFDQLIHDATFAAEVNLEHVRGISTESDKREMIVSILGQSVKRAGNLLDLLKKSVFYGKPLATDKFEANMVEFLTQMIYLLALGDFTLDGAMTRNIAKLRKRFEAGKFTEKAAIKRDLDAERKILEEK
jgi:NTP pyrophosphatase (non-canonical NTP hydrolase)